MEFTWLCFANKYWKLQNILGQMRLDAILLFCHQTIAKAKHTSLVEQMSIDLLPFMVLGLS